MSTPIHWVAQLYENGEPSTSGPPPNYFHKPEEVAQFISDGVGIVGFVPEVVVDEFRTDQDCTVEGELDLREEIVLVPAPGSRYCGHPMDPKVVITPVFQAVFDAEVEEFTKELLG